MTLWSGSEWVEDSPAHPSRPRRGRRFLGAAAEASIIVTLLFGLIAGTALAAPANGKGGGGSKGGKDSGSIVLIVLDGATKATHGGKVTFEVSASADRPFVGLRCWQGTTWVYDAYVGYFADYMYEQDWFVLDSPYWHAGTEATCTGRLFYYDKRGNQKVLATTDFVVAP